ncbi:MAG: phage holin family protein [Anaerolineales bacterium]|nr:phage holin family protein [Anaerolineales bacterium]
MTGTVRTIVLRLVRFAVLWVVDALSLLLTAWIMPGMSIEAVDQTPRTLIAISAAFLMAIVNLLVRPAILLVARPLGWVAMFVIGFLVNAVALWITAWLLPGFEVNFIAGLLGGIVFAIFNTIFTGIIEIDEEGSFYQNMIERRAKEQPFDSSKEPGRGLMMLEIDGLSYWHIEKAFADGLLPTLQKMIDEDGYTFTKVDCGLPSMTSACQAGIMFGDNNDIPAYRWYDKSKAKLYVSSSDATELNGRYGHGQGLMRHGSSIMNMLDGDAEKSMFTMANMFTGSEEEKKRRAQDVALLMLNPYFLTRELVQFFWEALREVWEGWQQKRKDVQPRLNRLEHWYPFLRAGMCSIARDMSANIAILDMMRGAPSIYMLYLGYDEVAHHSGPWTTDAFGDLKRQDKLFERLRLVAKEKAPRKYDFIILSDHGQSFGATFLQRYGVTIKELIEQLLPQGTTVAQSIGGDTGGVQGMQGMAGELANMQQSGSSNAMGRAVAKQGQKLAQAGAKQGQDLAVSGSPDQGGAASSPAPAAVTAYGSGNAAQVYFDLYPRKIKLSELNAAYPGMVDALVQHEGLGMVVGYADDMTAVVLGKGGSRNLHTGEVVGADPVAPYAKTEGPGAGSMEKRIWQLRRVMDFENAGDLWLISTVYPDGTVAALEELVGSHGGLGGEQTDAFIFHPVDMEVPDTRNSTDVFHILDRQRGKPVVEKAPVEAAQKVNDWAPSTLLTGLGRVGTWLGYAGRCIFLDRSAYADVVKDPYMTGPALLIAVVTVMLSSVVHRRSFDPLRILADLGLWVLAVAIVFAAGWLLTKRGTFTKTFRAVGFAQSVYVLVLLALFPVISGGIYGIVVALGFLAVWMGAAVAHETRGWRALVLPIVVLLVFVIGSTLVGMLIAGAQFTFQSVLGDMGVNQQ